MELGDKEIEKLQKYLNNKMSAVEKELFQKEINSSHQLKEFLNIFQQIDNFNDDEGWNLYQGDKTRLKEILLKFNNKETQEFSEKIKKFQKQDIESKTKKQSSWLKFVMGSGIAACLALLLYFTFFQSPNLNQLYLENSSWEELPSFTVKGDEFEKQKVTLEQLFKEKKYNDVIALSNEILNKSDILEPNILIYKGVSLLETNNFEDALQVFDSLIAHKNLIDYHKGYWYKALIYLKMGNQKETIKTLKYITTNKDYFNIKKAKSLLKKLK